MKPRLSTAKNYSGEIRRDFLAFRDPDKSLSEKLALVMKHIEYSPTDVQIDCALDTMSRQESKTFKVYDIAQAFHTIPSLQDFAAAIDKGFTWKDKYTVRWQTLYALMAKIGPDASIISAEFGSTEKSINDALNKLRNPRAALHNTKTGRFLRDVSAQRVVCYLWPLESYTGDLEAVGCIKDRWKLAGLAKRVRFPQRPHIEYAFERDPETLCREWPPFEAVVQYGIGIFGSGSQVGQIPV